MTNRGGIPVATHRIARGQRTARFEMSIPNARLWSLEDPFLHEVAATVSAAGLATDSVRTYFGMREISTMDLPGTKHAYVALNGKPIYLQLALDQAYHPTGFYTFPSDSFTRMEILRARQIGLNGLREHIKIETPRKLYWADKLGMLIRPTCPTGGARRRTPPFASTNMRCAAMIDRDYNHPSIFSWVAYNEAWGLVTKVDGKDVYLPETQKRVVETVRLAKSLDSTRLVEDNSPCCGRGHTVTDINSWHEYLPGWQWDSLLQAPRRKHVRRIGLELRARIPAGTRSRWSTRSSATCGATPAARATWTTAGTITARSTRSVGIRRWRGGCTPSTTTSSTSGTDTGGSIAPTRRQGVGELVQGMTLRDFHSMYYVAVGRELSHSVTPGQRLEVPLWASFLVGDRSVGDSLVLRTELYGWNSLGERRQYATSRRTVGFKPYMSEALAPLAVTMPTEPAVAVLTVTLEDRAGTPLHHNFTTFVVEWYAVNGRRTRRRPPRTNRARQRRGRAVIRKWSLKTWKVMDGLKMAGTGAGHFEYRIPWPAGLARGDVEEAVFLVEASAKQLYGKDRDTTTREGGDYMRGGGLHDPSKNRNAYPMTGERPYPSAVTAWVNGQPAGRHELNDDPADHRGILSWHAQLRDKFLRDAGSYGQLLRVTDSVGGSRYGCANWNVGSAARGE